MSAPLRQPPPAGGGAALEQATHPLLADLGRWEAAFGGGVLAGMAEGARFGLLPRRDAEEMAGAMLVCEARRDGVQVALRAFRGYAQADVDLLFVAEAEALQALHGGAADDPLALMRALVRDGAVLFFVMKTGRELTALGYEEFLDSLGLAFLGACR